MFVPLRVDAGEAVPDLESISTHERTGL